MKLLEKELAGCVIWDDHGRLMLIHRNKPDLKWWELPGGKIDEGESPEETAVRELKEEIGVSVEVIKVLGHTYFEYYGIRWKYHWFEARINEGDQPQICEPNNFDGLAYFEIPDLKNREDLSPNVANLLKIL